MQQLRTRLGGLCESCVLAAVRCTHPFLRRPRSTAAASPLAPINDVCGSLPSLQAHYSVFWDADQTPYTRKEFDIIASAMQPLRCRGVHIFASGKAAQALAYGSTPRPPGALT